MPALPNAPRDTATREIPLGVLQAEQESHRTLVVHCHSCDGSFLELRQQSWGGALGWFTNSSVRLDTAQLGQLRAMLATTGGSHPAARPALPNAGFTPRIVRVESA